MKLIFLANGRHDSLWNCAMRFFLKEHGESSISTGISNHPWSRIKQFPMPQAFLLAALPFEAPPQQGSSLFMGCQWRITGQHWRQNHTHEPVLQAEGTSFNRKFTAMGILMAINCEPKSEIFGTCTKLKIISFTHLSSSSPQQDYTE